MLGSLGAAAYRQEIGDTLPNTASDTLAGALLLAEQSGPAGDAIAAVARQTFIEGMHLAAFGAIAAMLLGAVVSVAAVRRARLVVKTPELVAA